MNTHVRNFNEASSDQLREFSASSADVRNSAALLFEENLDYGKKVALETVSFVQTLADQRSFSEALQLQAAFTRQQGAAFLDQCKRVAGLYQKMTNEAIQPLVSAATKAQNFSEHAAR